MSVFGALTAGVTTDAVFRALFNSIKDMLNLCPRYKYAVNSSDQSNSLGHVGTGVFSAGDLIHVNFFSSDEDAESGGLIKVIQVRGVAYGGTVGTLANGGTSGLIIEGLNYRFQIVPTAGGVLDIRRGGVRCVEAVTGWHSRFQTILDFAKNQQATITLTGSGVLSCTETVFLDRVNCFFPKLRFQGGTLPTGAVVGPATFFTATQSNNAVTITQANPGKVQWTAHGLANDTPIYLTTNGKLPGTLAVWQTGVGNGLVQYYVRNAGVNDFEVALTAGGASISTAAAAGYGTHYVFQAATQSNVTTQDIVEWNGKGVRLGIVVRAGTNGQNRDYLEQTLNVWGDGNSDRTTPPSTIAIRHEADDSPNGAYNYVTNYSYIGVAIQGPAEKHSLKLSGVYDRHLLYLLANSSADTLRVRVHGNNCQQWYTEAEGPDTSLSVDFDVETRDDPAADAGAQGSDAPAILIQNGKITTIGGEIRANNGLRNIVVWGRNSTTGISQRFGADSVYFKSLQIVHGFGIALELRAVRNVSGHLFVRDCDDANGVLAQNCPCLIVGRVVTAAGLHVHGALIKNNVGLHIGDAATLNMETGAGYYSKQASLGKWSIDMGTLTQFQGSGTENAGASAHPTTLTAVQAEKWDDCVIDLTGTRGNINLEATVEGGVMVVDPLAKLFTIDDASSPATSIGFPTLSTTGLTIT
jgi:hypothetical protein